MCWGHFKIVENSKENRFYRLENNITSRFRQKKLMFTNNLSFIKEWRRFSTHYYVVRTYIEVKNIHVPYTYLSIYSGGKLNLRYQVIYFFYFQINRKYHISEPLVSVRKIIESNKSHSRYINPDIYSIPVKKTEFPIKCYHAYNYFDYNNIVQLSLFIHVTYYYRVLYKHLPVGDFLLLTSDRAMENLHTTIAKTNKKITLLLKIELNC